jgi:hypothetical protein
VEHFCFWFEHIIIVDNPKPTGADAPLFTQTKSKHQTRQRKVFVFRAEVGYISPTLLMEQNDITAAVVVCAER